MDVPDDHPRNFSIFEPKNAKSAQKRTAPDDGEDMFDSRWGSFSDYMGAKKQKLLDQFQENAARTETKYRIFDGVAIFVNGHTDPSADELKSLMMLYGGIYHLYYNTTKTTHIIASNLPRTKITQLRTDRIVRPEWITESIEAGRLLPWENYELYPPQNTGNIVKIAERPFVHVRNVKEEITAPDDSDDVPVVGNHDTNLVNLEVLERTVSDGLTSIRDDKNVIRKRSDHPLQVAHKAGDPNYLQQFYARSRLHHLSMWKTESKHLVQSLQEKHDGGFAGREKLKELYESRRESSLFTARSSAATVIMHIDFDCFFVSAGLLSRPHLIGTPVAVCHGRSGHGKQKESTDTAEQDDILFNSRSEVSSCNYEARKSGLKNGMYLGPAKQLCPQLVTIPYEFELYKKISTIFYEVVASYTLDIEAISCDEMIVDCTEILQETMATPLEFATFLRKEIRDRTGCNASAGLGANQLLARLATKKAKPDGQCFVPDKEILSFMSDISVNDLPGAGHSAAEKFEKLGVKTCGSLQKISLKALQSQFGPKNGQKFYDFARGIDDRDVQNKVLRKSVSADINYGIRMKVVEEFESFFRELSEEMRRRLQTASVLGQTVTLKLLVRQPDAPFDPPKYMGCGKCNAVNRSVSLIQPTDSADIIAREGIIMFKKMEVDVTELRGIGVQITRLVDSKTVGKGIAVSKIDKFFKPLEQVDETERDEYQFDEILQDELIDVSPKTTPPEVRTDGSEVEQLEVKADFIYDLIAEVGWDRVYKKLCANLGTFLRTDLISFPAPDLSFSSNPTLQEKIALSEDVLVNAVKSMSVRSSPSLFDEEILAGHCSDPDMSPPENLQFLSEDDLENISFANIMQSTQIRRLNEEFPSTQPEVFRTDIKLKPQSSPPHIPSTSTSTESSLDGAAKSVFNRMISDVECRFWLNYFDIPEDFSMTELPPTMYGATLTYLDTPRVIRPQEVGGKFIQPIVLWAIWKMNAVYRKHWLDELLGHQWSGKGQQQKKLELVPVTATQAEVQKGIDLKVKGFPIMEIRKPEKVQMQLDLSTPPQPSTSKLTSSIPSSKNIIDMLPSPSKVDPDFLVALPDEILNEIFVLYEKKNGTIISKDITKVEPRMGVKLTKPTGKLHATVRKTKPKNKSKPSVTSSQKSLDGFFKTRKTNTSFSSSQDSKKYKFEKEMSNLADEILIVTTPPKDKLLKSKRKSPSPKPAGISLLFGTTTMGEVQKSLVETVKNSRPRKETADALVRFVDAALRQGSLSQADHVMKFLFREINGSSKLKRSQWIPSYDQIRCRVDQCTGALFMSRLKMPSFK